MTQRRSAVLLAVCLAAAVPSRAYDPDTGVASYDAVWDIVQRTYYDPDFGGLDWEALGERFRPRAEAARSDGDLRAVLRDLLAPLDDSHFAVVPAWSPDGRSLAGWPGFEGRLVDDDLLVTRVDPAGPAAAKGVRPGWIVESVDGTAVDALRARAARTGSPARDRLQQYLELRTAVAGPIGSPADFGFRDAAGKRRDVAVERVSPPGETFRLGNLFPIRSRFEDERVDAPGGASVAVFRFNAWTVPVMRALDEAVDRHRDADGWILDLRGNLGGLAQMVIGVSGHVLDERLSLGSIHARDNTLELRANPRRVSHAGERVEPFAGPVALLVDDLSYSASELFAAGLQDLGRARVFGVPTLGGVLAASFQPLPNGDLFEYPVAEYRTPSGKTVEGRGVVPDTIVRPERDALLAGRDPIREAALRWIDEERP